MLMLPGPSVVEVSACQGVMREKGESKMIFRGKTGLSGNKTHREIPWMFDIRTKTEGAAAEFRGITPEVANVWCSTV